jgi:hypothetical protein
VELGYAGRGSELSTPGIMEQLGTIEVVFFERRRANPFAVCKSAQKKYGWSKAKTERCIKSVKKQVG